MSETLHGPLASWQAKGFDHPLQRDGFQLRCRGGHNVDLEDGGRLPVGKTLRSDDLKGLANIEVSRTKTRFEYAIIAIKDKMTEFIAYLCGAAANQLDWDTKVLRKRAERIEQPVQSRKPETKNNGLGH